MGRGLLLFLAAVGTGILSAWGVGGGTLLLLLLTAAFGVEQQEARALNLLFFLAAGTIGLLGHRREGLVDGARVRRCLLPGMAAALLGALLGLRMETTLLRRAFGALLVVQGLRGMGTGKQG